MKANRKFIDNEEGVSPVIAVILMVAITVVLAATVFVLVNDLGKNVGTTGPSLGLVSDSAGSSTSQWTVKVSSATKLADLGDYRFVLTTPAQGTAVFTPSPTGTEYMDGYTMYAQKDVSAAPAANRTEGSETAFATTAGGYRAIWTDIDGNGKWSVGDTLQIKYDTGAADNNFDDTFSSGEYQLEILHTPSGSSAGSLPRTF